MAIDKINFSYPKGSLQSVFDNEALTALELASKTSKKVDECVEIVNGVEQTAIEATAIVDDMYVIQNQFVTDNSDTRAQLVNDNQEFITDLENSKEEFIDNLSLEVSSNVNNKIDELITDGTINNLINVDTEKSIVEATGMGVINGLSVLPQSNPDMSVLISTGTAHLYNGKRYELTANATITIDDADASFPRIDIIYINSLGTLTYGKGEAKTSPIAPTPISSLILAEIYVSKETSSIIAANITDKRLLKKEINAQIKENENMALNPMNYNSLNSAISKALETKTKLVRNKVTLTENTSFRGVEIHFTEIDINGFDLELGGISYMNGVGKFSTSPEQHIQKISNSEAPTGNVFIRSAMGQKIYIGFYDGEIKLRMNETLSSIAYSTFEFNSIKAVTIDNDDFVSETPSKILWCNENTFKLNQCNHFIIDGTFNHDMNRVFGGCFEGNSTIEIRKGTSNSFYNMRFEGKSVGNPTRGDIVITFGKDTGNNVIYKDYSLFPIEIIDEGVGNQVITQNINNYRLLNSYSIKSDTFNPDYQGGFKNLVKTVDTLGIKPVDYASTNTIWESEFIDNPKTLAVSFHCTRKTGNGLYFRYRVYDANFNDVSDAWKVGSSHVRSFFANKTNEGKLLAYDYAGDYAPPLGTILNSSLCDKGIFNDEYFITPTSHWENYKPLMTENDVPIKYVKFFVFPHSSFDATAEFYDIRINLYDITGNFKTTYFHN